MRSSSSSGFDFRGFDPRMFDPRMLDPRTFDVREAVERLRDAFGQRPRSTGHDGHDVRAVILAALRGGAKNGHQVMQAIASAHEGWMPAASEVYPTLQQLVDEGLATTQHDGERTVYALTEAGIAAAAEQQAQHATHPTEHRAPWSEHDAAVPKAGARLAQAAAQVAHSGTPEQKERAAALLDETRRALYAILAEG